MCLAWSRIYHTHIPLFPPKYCQSNPLLIPQHFHALGGHFSRSPSSLLLFCQGPKRHAVTSKRPFEQSPRAHINGQGWLSTWIIIMLTVSRQLWCLGSALAQEHMDKSQKEWQTSCVGTGSAHFQSGSMITLLYAYCANFSRHLMLVGLPFTSKPLMQGANITVEAVSGGKALPCQTGAFRSSARTSPLLSKTCWAHNPAVRMTPNTRTQCVTLTVSQRSSGMYGNLQKMYPSCPVYLHRTSLGHGGKDRCTSRQEVREVPGCNHSLTEITSS